MMDAVQLCGHGYALTVDPAHGGTLLAATWRHPQGHEVPLLVPLADPAAGMGAGSFLMAPFVNRIADGRFAFAGQDHLIPVNRPAEGMAIHGTVRDRVWRLDAAGPGHATMSVTVDDFGPWRFTLHQHVTLSPDGITVALDLRNDGNDILPFGMGLHPWFPRPAGTTLTLAAGGAYARDGRGLPLPATMPVPGLTAASVALDSLPPLDSCLAGWTPRRAVIGWPGQGTALTLTATGALRHLHLYLPAGRPVFCAEPVSHLPDAVNRPELGPDAAMTPLAPGATLSGAMILAATPDRSQP